MADMKKMAGDAQGSFASLERFATPSKPEPLTIIKSQK
jgi:hypothetical protein